MRSALKLLLIVGIAMILFVAPLSCAVNYAGIDAVLTPAELANDHFLAIAQRMASQNRGWWFVVASGILITVISFTGLYYGSKSSSAAQ
jgi:drug/metabolite transporter (DMT)-like permease